MMFRVARMGGHATRFLTSRNTARIAAVFERSLYFEADGAFCCVGTGSIGNGPINAVIEAAQTPSWLRGTHAGHYVEIDGSCAHWQGHRLEFSQARIWRPEPWPKIANASGLQSALACVETVAARDAPPEGLSRRTILPTSNDDAASPLDRLGGPRIKALSDWIFVRLGVEDRPGNSPAPPVDLLGLGPGLTPSGDDVLCGVMIALDGLGRRDAASELAAAIQAEAPATTSPLSAAFLEAAAQGQGSEALHRFIAAAIAADLSALPETIAALGRIGHSSGWDAMGGAVLTLKAAVTAGQARQSP